MNFTPKFDAAATDTAKKGYEPVTKYMAKHLITFKPEDEIGTVIHQLNDHQISGAPVLNEHGELIGIISQQDCLRVVMDSVYHNQPVTLPPLTTQYADFSAWQRQWLADERLDAELNYWKNQLGDGDEVLELSTDYKRPSFQTTSGAHIGFSFSKELNCTFPFSSFKRIPTFSSVT